MIRAFKEWINRQAEAAERLERSVESLNRSIGRLDAIVGQAVKDNVAETRSKAESLRADLENLKGHGGNVA